MHFWTQRFGIPEEEKNAVTQALANVALHVGKDKKLFSNKEVYVHFNDFKKTVELIVTLPADREAFIAFKKAMQERITIPPKNIECEPLFGISLPSTAPETVEASFSLLKQSKRVTTQDATGQRITLHYHYTDALAHALGVHMPSHTRER